MKVILCENVPNLGEMGSTVNVADGYARNFLLPRKMAVEAESASAREIEHQLRIIGKREAKVRAEKQEEAQRMEGIELAFAMRAGENDRLFGSVTNGMIAEQLNSMGFAVDRRKVHLEEPIKQLGAFDVGVELHRGVESTIKVTVTPEVEEEEVAVEEDWDEGPEESSSMAHTEEVMQRRRERERARQAEREARAAEEAAAAAAGETPAAEGEEAAASEAPAAEDAAAGEEEPPAAEEAPAEAAEDETTQPPA